MHIARLFIWLAAFAVLFPTFATASDDSVRSFETFLTAAKKSTNTDTFVFFNKHRNGWIKKRHRVVGLKFDIKKTDSLVTPIVGIVILDISTDSSDTFPSKEEAEKISSFTFVDATIFRKTLNYTYRDGKWAFSRGDIRLLFPYVEGVAILELTADGLIQSHLSHWLPK